MFYKFPVIENINDVLPHIEGRPEFIVADRDDHIIINYAVAFADTFGPIESEGDVIRRECRGMIFRKEDGRIVRRPFHKFFNVGEKEETQPDVIRTVLDRTTSLEKLDGSMISPYRLTDDLSDVRFGTKMGDTDVAKMIQPFLALNPQYVVFANAMIDSGFTPIFEFCSRSQRIVIDYPEDRLVLTAVRHMETGEYLHYGVMKKIGIDKGIEVVGTLDFDTFARDVEGVVLRTFEGHMLKMKCESYVRIHKAKDKISVEKNAVAAILNNEIDDILPELAPEDQERIETLSADLHQFLINRAEALGAVADNNIAYYGDKKTFALECALPAWEKAAIFKVWDTQDAYGYIKTKLENSLSRIVTYNDFKSTWGFESNYGQ